MTRVSDVQYSVSELIRQAGELQSLIEEFIRHNKTSDADIQRALTGTNTSTAAAMASELADTTYALRRARADLDDAISECARYTRNI